MRSTFRSLVFQSRCLTTNFNRLLVPRQGPILRHFRGSAAASGHNSSRRVPINIPPSEERTHFRSWSNYAVPAVLLVITGAGLLIHYNDERRAVVKGVSLSRVTSFTIMELLISSLPPKKISILSVWTM